MLVVEHTWVPELSTPCDKIYQALPLLAGRAWERGYLRCVSCAQTQFGRHFFTRVNYLLALLFVDWNQAH